MNSNDISLKPIDRVFLFATLIFLEAIIFTVDQILGRGVSIRPLFVIPIILAALFVNSLSTIFFVIISTLLHVESYRLSDFGPDKIFNYTPNIIALLINYLLISAIVTKAIKYRDKSFHLKQIMVQNNIDAMTNEKN